MAITSYRGEESPIAATVVPFLETLNSSSQSILLPPEGPAMSDKERELMEYYATYNVWTGVRTAVTLTLFFLFTVTVIVYKSKCKRHRTYELYPSLQNMPSRPVDYYDYFCPTQAGGGENFSGGSVKLDAKDIFCRVYDDGTIDPIGSAPLPTHLKGGSSFSSIYNSFRIKSLPGSVLKMNLSRMGSLEREQVLSHYAVPSYVHEYLRVPGVRLQSTGSSSDGFSVASSSFDINCEQTPMTLLGVPGMSGKSKTAHLQTGGIDWDADQATNDWLQSIDINVIQPTPNVSPCGSVCGSVRSISSEAGAIEVKLEVPPRKGRPRMSSISSVESQDVDTASMTSDSVFLEDTFCENEIFVPKPPRGPRCLKPTQSLDETTRKAFFKTPTPELRSKHSSLKNKQKVHSFRLPINASGAASPMPSLLQGQPLQMPIISSRGNKGGSNLLGSNLGLPMGVSLSGSCEKLAAHGTLRDQHDSLSQPSSTGSLQLSRNSSFEEPVVTNFIVPGLRRVNSAMNYQTRMESKQHPKFKRAESEISASGRERFFRRDSNSSSSSTEASDSVSFHLMVPHLSFDCPSGDTSRASSPSPSPTPPGSPMGASLIVPNHYHRSSSPSRGRLRLANTDSKAVLKRQYSQYMPASPREKPPSPFVLPTSFEEEEEIEEECLQNENLTNKSQSEMDSKLVEQYSSDSSTMRETKF